MSITLVPYNQAMRLGQGYNTYLQQICIDRAVTFGPDAVRVVPSETGDVSTVPKNDDVSIRQEVRSKTSQIVTYKTAFTDKLSDIVENLNISAAAGIRSGTLSASGSAAYVNENKFKESHINFVVNVKATNDKAVLDQDKLTFNEIKSVMDNANSFTEHYGDGFISGFIEGGELNGIVNIKLQDSTDVMSVKAQIQVSMKMVDVAGSGSLQNSSINKTAETNITINWLGGGQIKEPKAEWNIQSLLAAAAEFPSKVAECPQRTWAIITKYKHLRDYVEKVQKPTFMEYELAATYTAVLLDNFIEYKLMMKTIGFVMENISDYEKSSASDAYGTDIKSLVNARMDIQMEMAKIVLRVNEINLDPKKALELAKPGTLPSYTDSHVYSARLPVVKLHKDPPPPIKPAEPLPFWLPTPRSKLDPITFKTTEIRSIEKPSTTDTRAFKFSSPRPQAPQLAMGVTYLDMNVNFTYRLDIDSTDRTTTGFTLTANSWADTVKYAAGATWFEVSPTDPEFQQGRANLYLNMFPADYKALNMIKFPRAYTEDVEILIWLNYLDLSAVKANFIMIDASVQEVSRVGFQLWYGTSGANNNVYGLGYNWIAYPKSKKGVESGLISKQKVSPNTGEVHSVQEVKFKKEFSKPPRVWLAWSGMEVTNAKADNMRLMTEVVADSITITGFKYQIDLKSPVILGSLSLSWIAVELDQRE